MENDFGPTINKFIKVLGSSFAPLFAGKYAKGAVLFKVIGMKGFQANGSGHVIFFEGDMNTTLVCALIFGMV